ncbi:hypothetical protein, partial [Streptomyces roseolus]|uniref:hypothetical protein n=1 Tax=Streptomyces roseolus TaxID=67358 RepID=UPI00366352C5
QSKLTAEEVQQLQDAALKGDLGSDMQAAAQLVASGQDTWQAMFASESSNSGLLAGNLDKSISENAGGVRSGLAGNDLMPKEYYS